MTVIRQQDPIDSVADALQYISYYHPMDYIDALGRACLHPHNTLRASIVADPAFARRNTRDDTPAVMTTHCFRV